MQLSAGWQGTVRGKWLGVLLRDARDTLEVEMAEALAVLKGFEFVAQLGVQCIIVETNSLMFVNVVKRGDRVLSYFGRLVDDVLRIRNSFESMSFVWVRRSVSVVAHKLANSGLDCETLFFAFFFFGQRNAFFRF